ncbi:MAG: hypothetical protein KBG09_07700 [Syntrophobacterales bacterium]|nr:hypothetical protein [Syntrophobacterales bacterium]
MKADYLDWFLSISPPRRVEPEIQRFILNYFFPKSARLIIFYFIPVSILLMCIVISAIMLFLGNYSDELRLWKGPTENVEGAILSVEELKRSKGRIFYLYKYTYRPPGNTELVGASFSDRRSYKPGERVIITYLYGDHKISCLQGARMNPVPVTILAVPLSLSLVVGAMPFFMMNWRKKWIFRLLRDGVKTTATILAIKWAPKGTRNVTLSFNLEGRETTLKINIPGRKKTIEVLEALHLQRLQATILVDPKTPKRLIIIETLEMTA